MSGIGQAGRRPGFAAGRLLCSTSLSAALLFAIPSAAYAQDSDRHWDANGTSPGNGGTGTWNTTGGNWGPDDSGQNGPYVPPWNNLLDDNAIFGGTAGVVTLGTPITVHDITFNTSGYTLTGNTLTLSGLTPTITVTSGSSTIASALAGTAGLVKEGVGGLALTGANTLSGDITINAGTLSLSGTSSLSGDIYVNSTTRGALTILSDAALGAVSNRIFAAANSALVISPTLSAGRVITLGGGGQTFVEGAGAASARYTGAGGLTAFRSGLTNNLNDYTGKTTFSWDNSITFSSVGNLGEASALGAPVTVADGTITVAPGGGATKQISYTGSGSDSNRNWEMQATGANLVFANTGTGKLTLRGDIALTGTAGTGVGYTATSADMDLLGQISGTLASVAFNGSAGRTITLGGANSFNASASVNTITVKAGVLANSGVNSSLGAGTNVSLSSGGVLSYTGAGASSNRTWTVSGAGTLSNDSLTGSLNLSGPLAFVAGGPVDTLTLGGSYAGGVNTFSGVISGAGGLTSNGSGIWELTAANTRTGALTVTSGTLRAGNAAAFGTVTGTTVDGGTLDLNGTSLVTPTLNGTGGTIALGTGDITVNGAVASSYGGSITGSGPIGLIKTGVGTLTLTGQNSYTGATNVGGGTLRLDFSGAATSDILSSASVLNLSGGGTLSLVGAAETNSQNFAGVNILSGSNTIRLDEGAGGSLTLNLGALSRTAGTVNFVPEDGLITTTNIDGALGGWALINNTDYAKVVGGNIVAFDDTDYTGRDDAGTWLAGEIITDEDTLNNTSFFGTVASSVQLGGLRFVEADPTTTITIAGGQTLGVDGAIIVAPSVLNNSQLITGGSIAGSAGGGTLAVQQSSGGNFQIASQIVDNGGASGFLKGGSGLVTLTGANSYTGATTISQGVLSVSSIGNGGAASNVGASSADASNLIVDSSELRYTGATATTDRGFTVARTLGVDPTINVTTAGSNLTFSGQVVSSDSAGLTKTGAGTLTLANSANSYAGVTRISGGTLAISTIGNGGGPSSLGASSNASANLVIETGGILQYTGTTATTDRGMTLNGAPGGVIDVTNAGTSLTFGGVVASIGPAPLRKEGAGTLVLSGINTYTGTTTVNGGTLRAGSTQAFGSPGLVTLANTAGATLDLAGFSNKVGGLGGGGASGGNVLLGGATLTIGGTNASFSGTISGAGALIKDNTSTQTFLGCNNSYTGATTIQGSGTLTVDCLANGGFASGIGASGAASSNLIFINGALNYTGGTVTTNRGFSIQGFTAGAIGVENAATTLTFTGQVTGASGIVRKDGAGTLVLSGTNIYGGGTVVSAGTLRAGSTSAFGTGGITVNAGTTLDLNGFSNSVSGITGSGNITLGSATLGLTDGGGLTFSGAISGTGGLAKSGAGTQVLSGCNNSYAGPTTISGGILSVNCLANGGSNSAIGASGPGAGNLILNGGTLQYTGGLTSTDRQFTLGPSVSSKIEASGTGPLILGNSGAIAFSTPDTAQTIKLGGTNTGGNSLAALITNNGSGATSFTKEDGGTWILTNQNSTYTGVTSIVGGVLGVSKLADGGSASSIGASAADASFLVIGSGTTLRYTGTGDTTNRLFTLSGGNTFLESAGTGAIAFTNTGAIGFSGSGARNFALGGSNTGVNIMGASIANGAGGITTLAKSDAGTWYLTGTNTYTGNTNINAGTLFIGNGGTTGSIASANINNFGTLGFNRSDAVTYAGTITGTGSVLQAGTGTTILTGTSNYTGGTTISAGTLQLGSGGSTGAIIGNVTNNGTLAFNRNNAYTFGGAITGTGTIAQIGTGATTLTAANTAGATTISAGTLNVNGSLQTNTVAMTGSTLNVNGTLGGPAGSTAIFTGDAGASTINVASGATLRGTGDLGGGSDVVNVTGTLDTGAGTFSLGAGDDTLVFNTGIAFSIFTGKIDGGSGTDILQISNTAPRNLDGASVTGFESLDKTLSSTLILTGDHSYINGVTNAAGVLQIGNGTATGTLVGNVANSGTLTFNRAGTSAYAGVISGTGTVNHNGTGTTTFTGNNSYAGATNVTGGTLLVNGDQSAATGLTTVASGATLGGTGVIGGSVTVADGTLAAGSNGAGTLTIGGNLTLGATSQLAFEFGQANTPGGLLNDLVNVGGNLTLDGTVNVTETAGGTFGPGVYRMFNYTGTLTDNGLIVGTVPGGAAVVQTSVANQVNLVNTAGLGLSFWDGAAGPKFDGLIQGGDGTWRLDDGANNWTDENGQLNADYAQDSFAIFQGTGGIVTVDNSGGNVLASGMQFTADGYRITGAPLTLTGTQAFVRIGDGSATDVSLVTTIDAVLAGSAELIKDGDGTLVLAGANTYTGGTAINGGTLQVSSDANLGAASGGLSFDGGTLASTASFASGRNVTLDGAGTVDTAAGTTLAFTQAVSGPGALTKAGAGMLTLAADNGYTGVTTINAGTLQIGNGGASGAIVSDVVNNGGTLTFNRTGTSTYGGAITGTGPVNVLGGVELTLTGDSNYAGDTTVTSSELRLAGGGSITTTGTTAVTGDTGTLTVNGAGSSLTTNVLDVARVNGTSTVNIENGGLVRVNSTGLTQIGSGNPGQTPTGILNVDGVGSLLDVAGSLELGRASAGATGLVNVTNGGAIQSAAGAIGFAIGGSNATPSSATVSGAGSRWTMTNAFTLRGGSLSVLDGGTVSAASAATGPASSNILVSGAGSNFALTGNAVIGSSGPNTAIVTLADGGRMGVGGQLTLASGAGTAILNIGGGEGQAATAAGILDAATLAFGPGTGRLNFNHSDPDYIFATAMSGTGAVNQVAGVTNLTGNSAGFGGATTVSGGTLRVNGTLGNAASTVSVLAGGILGGGGTIGGNVSLVDGATLAPGSAAGPGTLTINGNLGLSSGSTLAYEFGQSNFIGGPLNDHTAVGGNLTLDGTIDVSVSAGGAFGPGLYRVISYGGTLTDNGLELGTLPAGSLVSVQTSVAGQVNLINATGATLNFWDGAAGPKNEGAVSGGSGLWQNSSGNDNWTLDTGAVNGSFADASFAIFTAAAGTVTVDNSLGAVTASGMQFASDGYIVDGGALTLSDPQSVIRVGDGTTVGQGFTATIAAELTGSAQLVKADLGTLVLTGTNSYTGGTQIDAGTLRIASDANLGDAAGGLGFDGGTLNTTGDIVSGRAVDLAGNGNLITDAGTTLTLNGIISGAGGLTKGGDGSLVLTGANSYGGDTLVNAGSLFVNGDQSAATGLTSIASGATLGGSGTIGGNVILADGATLAAGTNNVGTLAIGGNLALGAASVLDFEFGAANVPGGALNDLVDVGGDLVLDGTINVTVPGGGSFGPGIYRVFNYGGALTDNGLALGAIPGGSVSVQTAIAGQVNLVNSAGLTLSFWDGTVGPKNNGAVNGGDGTWRVGGGSNNWADMAGAVNADYAQDSFAIFSAAPGTVTVDNSGGNVLASGMQFASDGYVVTGDALTLTGAQAIVQVGDGSVAGAAYVATIDAELGGSAGLVKTDAGTLVLGGTNSYTGGTSINGGTIRIGADANLGAAAGGLAIDGGTLHTTADIVSSRAVDLVGAGTFLTDAGTSLTLGGAVSGAGSLGKSGDGTLVLTASNNYAGGTVINAGVLQLGDGGTGGSIVGDVVNNGALAFNRSDIVTFGGLVSGGGAASQTGTGTTIFTANNSYAGGTTIAAGTLQLGDGGTSGSITGDVANNGTLAFNRSDSVTFAGLISGSGGVDQTGSGTTILSGGNSYAGATNVIAGSLLVNGDQSAATGLTSVAAGATLGGSGIIGGDVTVAGGATLAPGAGAPGALTINGNLALVSGARLGFEFGQANDVGGPLNDVVNVGGNLVLDGTLDVAVPTGGAFDIGLYRVINYAGALTDNGLALGAMPAGANAEVQTSIAGEVNLINTGSATLNFWDGAAGPKFDGAVNGGDGVWQNSTGNDNWADISGAVNAGYDDGAFAIFSGTAGTVTIDNGLGAVSASGMQFAADGYVIAGDALTLDGAQAVIRVGDGTAGGAAYVATIDAELAGTAGLVKTDAGTLVLTGGNSYTGGTSINGGTLQIGADANLGGAAGAISFDGGTLRTTSSFTSLRGIDLAGTGTFLTDAGTVLTLGGALSGAGSFTKSGTGTLVLDGSGTFGGATVAAGTMFVNGGYAAATGTTNVLAGATMGGTGTIGGNVAYANGATLAPGAGAAGTLTIGGNLSLSATTQLDFEFGEAGTVGGALNDLVNVGGDLVLDGVLNVGVPAGGAFDVGVYRMFNYGGALTDNGVTLGTLPGGANAQVQTSVVGQVNLVNSAGLTLNFWDGAAGPKNDGVINGGDGIWQNSGGNDNWTDASGAVNAAYSDGAFAIFGGTGGTVTVDDGQGAITAAGMQFAANNYVITGDGITLTDPTATIRVGDGSAAGANFTATINSALGGAAQLVKTDAGTLVLGGANGYAGGTLITGGAIRIANDGNLGAADGAVTLDGGALETSATMTSARDFIVASEGTISTAADTVFTYDGLFAGTGSLTKAGAGTLLVTADNSGFGGSTSVAAGTLAVQGSLGGTVSVAATGRLEGTGRVGGLVNAGIVAPGRGEIGTLTVAGDYGSNGGTLEIEAELGGDGALTDRLVVNGATSGSTRVTVTNRGGLGAQTVEGIKIIDVAGASNGSFALEGDYLFDGEQAVIAGAFGYRLYKNGITTPQDGDWYLRSSLLNAPNEPQGPLYQPGVPLYENYGQVLASLNTLPTLQERVGNRQWAVSANGTSSGIWGRMESTRARPEARMSTAGTDANIDSWKVQIGADRTLSENESGVLVAGLTGHYGESNASVRSIFGDGTINAKGYGAGATLTWYSQGGFYADAQAQFAWFDGRLTSSVLGTLVDGNDGTGKAFSLELGKRAMVGGGLTVTPQVQMIYQDADFDSFADPSEAMVSSARGDSLKTRWGISLDHQNEWESKGTTRRSHLYGLVNVSYEWLDGTEANVSGTAIRISNDRLWGEIALGGSLGLNDRVTIYTQASASSPFRDFGDDYSIKGVAGVRVAF